MWAHGEAFVFLFSQTSWLGLLVGVPRIGGITPEPCILEHISTKFSNINCNLNSARPDQMTMAFRKTNLGDN